jgi:threonylcarbamoyladenosine tRNA methylthiotransferase MtaB
MKTARLRIQTLGCKVNQYETQFVRERLLGIGYVEAESHEPADLCVINTCTVTSEGDAKSRQLIRRVARQNPGARMIVMGCYATRAPREVASLPGVADVITDKHQLSELLGRLGVTDLSTGISSFGHRHRAYVKVQDGCLLRCSYCIIPQVRPSMRSRPSAEILAEVRRLRDNGHREMVLTGVHLGHYGVDGNRNRPKSDWVRLADLVRQIAEEDGDFRVRLSSIEEAEVTRELIDVMAEFPTKICPHLHICLQSGSDSVLRRMNRRGGVQRFRDRCRRVREVLDQPALTTDVMVGFPGESDKDFADTCRTVRECGFSKVHIFPFSPRQGTPAAQMPGRVPQPTVSQRCRHLACLERELRGNYFQQLAGRRLQVLVESSATDQPRQVTGTACRYAPVQFAGDPSQRGTLVEVTAGPSRDGQIRAVRV